MIHSNESNQAFCFPLLTFSNSSSASFNWLCNADTLRSNRSTWSVLHNGLYGSVKFLENDLRASTPVTCQFAILIKDWYRHNSFSCSVFVSCRVDTRTFNLKCRCYSATEIENITTYLFWKKWQLGNIKVIIQHVKLVQVLLLHFHSCFK